MLDQAQNLECCKVSNTCMNKTVHAVLENASPCIDKWIKWMSYYHEWIRVGRVRNCLVFRQKRMFFSTTLHTVCLQLSNMKNGCVVIDEVMLMEGNENSLVR